MATDDVEIADSGPPVGLEVDKLFRAAVRLVGSDLHLKVGRAPLVRVNGVLRPMKRGPIDDAEMEQLCLPMLSPRHQKMLDEEGGADFAHLLDVDGQPWR